MVTKSTAAVGLTWVLAVAGCSASPASEPGGGGGPSAFGGAGGAGAPSGGAWQAPPGTGGTDVPNGTGAVPSGGGQGAVGAGGTGLVGGMGATGGTVNVGGVGAAPNVGGTTNVGATGGTAGGGGAGATTGAFPPIQDPGQAGSFTPTTTQNTGPGAGYTTIVPAGLGQDGLRHPIVIWGNGALMSPPLYPALLDHMASHGFAVIAYNVTPEGAQMTAAIDWMIEQDTTPGSPFEGKLDTTKIASMGHSAGSVATFAIAADPRLTTTLHLNGGTFDPHTEISNLQKPAIFMCGEPGGDGLLVGDVARPNCDIDFQLATTPVWYGVVVGSSHMTISSGTATDPMMARGYLAAVAGWLRWHLMGDQTMEPLFRAPSCTFCSDTTIWDAQEKNWP